MLKLDLQHFASVDDQTTHAGHTLVLKINGIIIGKAQGLDGDRSFGTEGQYEIGSIMPQEHINLKYEGSITLERFLARNSDLAKAGFASLGEEVLKKGLITLEVQDKYTNKAVRSYHGLTIVRYSESIRANAIAGENSTWTYLYAK